MSAIPDLHDLAARDGRYDAEAFCFVSQALRHAAKLFKKERLAGKERHLGAEQLVQGVVDLAAERYGLLAELVLARWGLRSAEDVGAITFALIASQVFAKQDGDRIEDFAGLPPFAEALRRRVTVHLGDA